MHQQNKSNQEPMFSTVLTGKTISVTHGHSLYAFIPFVFLFMVFSILELWCLDSMLVVHLPSLHSAFRNYVASIS